MNSYLIFTDSAADMPLHVIEEFDIRFIPMDYMLDGESVTFHTEDPDRDRHCDELYEKLRKGASVHTSQITPWTYIENWKPLLEEGHDILYLAFSSGLSATYENAMNAAGTLQEYAKQKAESSQALCFSYPIILIFVMSLFCPLSSDRRLFIDRPHASVQYR